MPAAPEPEPEPADAPPDEPATPPVSGCEPCIAGIRGDGELDDCWLEAAGDAVGVLAPAVIAVDMPAGRTVSPCRVVANRSLLSDPPAAACDREPAARCVEELPVGALGPAP